MGPDTGASRRRTRIVREAQTSSGWIRTQLTMCGVPRHREQRARRVFSWFSLDIIYYPVSAIMWVWYKAFAFLLGAVELLRLGAVGDVPGVHLARDPLQAVRQADPHHAADAGVAAADQGAAEEVRQGPPADGAGDAEAPARARLQPDPRLSADAGPAAGVPRALSRADVVQPDPDRHRPAGVVGGGEPVAGQLRVQRDRRRALPRREPVRRAAGRDDDPAARPGGVHGIQPVRGHRRSACR